MPSGLPSVASALVWALVAFSAVTWCLRWSALARGTSSARVAQPTQPELDVSLASRSLGALAPQAEVAPSLASRLVLQGVMTRPPAQGAALMSVDGKPARPYRVGSAVVDGLVLQSVQARRVSLGAHMDEPPSLVLELPTKK